MCYNGSGTAQQGELEDREWFDIVQQAIDLGILEAIISGGEPLLRGRDFVLRILHMLTDAGVAIHLITNGSYVTPDFVRSLRGINLRICQTSIDGPNADIHDSIRGRKNYDLATRAAHLFASHGFNTRIGCTLQRRNQDYIHEMVDQAVMLGAHDIVIDEFLPIGRSMDIYPEIVCTKPHDKIREEVLRSQKIFHNMILVLEGMTCQDQLRQQAAMEVNDSIIIRPDGELRLGCMAPFSAGNVREQGLAKAWERLGAYAWKTDRVRQYVESVRDNPSLMAEQRRLGIRYGYENVNL
jgi:MoaA/NifB/PqqE/SkfB family radical SAM enzyme